MHKNKTRRWRVAQSKEDTFWRKKGVLTSQMCRVYSRYGSVISELSYDLGSDAQILDVGCGPTCAAQLFNTGLKAYLDPLMESYETVYGKSLPEGEKICAVAERIPKDDETFDVVLCINALDHMLDPDTAAGEVHRVLKKDGMLVLGIFTYPAPIYLANRFIEGFLPMFKNKAHPHAYTLQSIRALLNRHFVVEREIRVFKNTSTCIPSLHREDWMFIGRKP